MELLSLYREKLHISNLIYHNLGAIKYYSRSC